MKAFGSAATIFAPAPTAAPRFTTKGLRPVRVRRACAEELDAESSNDPWAPKSCPSSPAAGS